MRAATIVLLTVAGAGLAAWALLLQPLYIGAVPVPVGTVITLLSLPWLIRFAADVSSASPVIASPLIVWIVVVGVLGFAGPGGDVLLPATWQSLVLLVAGLLSGVIATRRALEATYSG
ncbi:hypothetical protein [Pseudonocardia sp. WMMC193]|uniref:hypothetical protein n=1 Tax=Pseudonocardia sp. WMMC193 TaxID=2911965 RepID=UPI001F30709D|nr:hypothetical protein [Pseudonocardia sp. WMMC193]MCF7551160.1 hypothetical protein [Pseudonocardia sp. WMMC193]